VKEIGDVTMTNAALQARVNDFNWLLSSFAENTTGVEQAICVSADGLLMAMSSTLDRASADKLAAIVSGLRSLSDGASRVMGRGGVNQVIVEMKEGYLFASSIGHGSSLGVLTTRTVDLGLVGYAMTLFVQRVGAQLTPELITELKNSLGR
jgi:predicted regulator of Ras-like GTPase activity (Roadblock/LC7/MglB family)